MPVDPTQKPQGQNLAVFLCVNRKKQLAQKKKDEEEAQRKKDSEYDFEHEDYEMQDVPADSPEQKVQAMQSKAKGEQPGKPDETLKRIAAVMKALGMTAADL